MDSGLKKISILLVGNYPCDGQRSMERFAGLLCHALRQKGCHVDWVKPPVIFNRLHIFFGKPSKWLGYLDKLILFPIILFFKKRAYDLVHICDHSNSHYLSILDPEKTLVTCHDCLAIRAARDEIEGVSIGRSGKLLQKYILRGLIRARWVACDSENSRQDVVRLAGIPGDRASVLYLGRQDAFCKIQENECIAALAPLFAAQGKAYAPYLLHVSNNNWYKNRMGLVRLYRDLAASRPHTPMLVMAGALPTRQVRDEIAKLDLSEKIIHLTALSDHELCCLYNQAELLLFPSFEEGFGWPILEAYSCGCRVVTSGRSSMKELGGEPAFYADPYNIETFLPAIRQALDELPNEKEKRVGEGFRQVSKFSNEKMTSDYLEQYARILDGRRR